MKIMDVYSVFTKTLARDSSYVDSATVLALDPKDAKKKVKAWLDKEGKQFEDMNEGDWIVQPLNTTDGVFSFRMGPIESHEEKQDVTN